MSSLRYLVDTNVVSKLARVRPPAELVARFSALEANIALSVVTAEELRFGAATAPAERRPLLTAFVRGVLQRFPILPYDADAAEWVAQARAALKSKRRTIEHPDLCIAGIAGARGLIVVTENLKHFTVHADLQVLSVEAWLKGD